VRDRRLPWSTSAVVALLAVGLAPGWLGIARVRREVLTRFDNDVHGMWESIPFERAIVLFANDMHTRLVEYELLRGEKVGLEIVNPLLLPNPRYRRSFAARHGFDPMEGIDRGLLEGAPHAQELSERVGGWLNQKSPLPIILFDPGTGLVRLLRKPGG
jgi:hypothetical protein